MVFKAETAGSDDLKAIISAVSTLVDEATFVASAEGITFRGMDPSHVALIDISWPNSAFEKYECDGDIRFGVKIDELGRLIKRVGKKDKIEIGISDDNKLLVTISGTKKYKIRMIESSSSETPLPKVTYDAKMVMDLQNFDRILGDIDVVSEYLTVTTKGSKSVFSGKGDSGEVSLDVKGGDEGVREITASAESTATYSLEYLNPITKAIGSAAEDITCEYSESKPLRLEFKVSNIGRIHFYLAPRVDS